MSQVSEFPNQQEQTSDLDQAEPQEKPKDLHRMKVERRLDFHDDLWKGIGSIQGAARGIWLQCWKKQYTDYSQGLERDKWIGLKLAGHDPAAIDREIHEARHAVGVSESEDEDVDSSVRIAGDTNIYVQSADQIPNVTRELGEGTTIRPPKQPPPTEPVQQPQPAPQPQPTPAPIPPPLPVAPEKPRMPTWAKWLLGAAVAGNAIGIPAAALLSRGDTTVIKPQEPGRQVIGLEID